VKTFHVAWHFSGCKDTQTKIHATSLRQAAEKFCEAQGFHLRGFHITRKRSRKPSWSFARAFGHTGAGPFNATIIPD
jgi:hypothetical protein